MPATLVTVGASYDWAAGGRTHHAPGEVALLDTLPEVTVRVPGHPTDVARILDDAALRDDLTYVRLSLAENASPFDGPLDGFEVLRKGRGAAALVVGPLRDAALLATQDLDFTVIHTLTPRPLDTAGLAAICASFTEVAIIEPYLEGTSTALVAAALSSRPRRLTSIGVPRRTLGRYGTRDEHDAAYALDARGLYGRLAPLVR